MTPKSALVAAGTLLALSSLAVPAAAAPFGGHGGAALSNGSGIVTVGHRHHHRDSNAAAAAAVGVGAFALGVLAGAGSRPAPEVYYSPAPVYRPAPPRVIYREAPPVVYDCHIERSRSWDPYIGATVIRERRVCY